jgi:hypothetical protein
MTTFGEKRSALREAAKNTDSAKEMADAIREQQQVARMTKLTRELTELIMYHAWGTDENGKLLTVPRPDSIIGTTSTDERKSFAEIFRYNAKERFHGLNEDGDRIEESDALDSAMTNAHEQALKEQPQLTGDALNDEASAIADKMVRQHSLPMLFLFKGTKDEQEQALNKYGAKTVLQQLREQFSQIVDQDGEPLEVTTFYNARQGINTVSLVFDAAGYRKFQARKQQRHR